MTGPDDMLAILRRARPDDLPDELASPQSPAAQAMLEEILSMETITTPGTSRDAPVVRPPGGARRSRRVLVAAAAAAVTVTLVGAVLTFGSTEPTAAATIDAAVERTSDLMGRSGRAEQRVVLEVVDGRPAVNGWSTTYEFSDNDISVGYPYRGIYRVVDGQAYEYGPVDPDTDLRTVDETTPFEWRHLPGDYDPESFGPGPFDHDPRTLLETLSSAGGFDVVGDEVVDGLPTHHLRAARPEEAFDLAGLRQGVDGTATSLDVWVDDEGLVRRLDFRIEDPWDVEGSWTSSIRFTDLGEPVVIEAPADAREWVPPPDAGSD